MFNVQCSMFNVQYVKYQMSNVSNIKSQIPKGSLAPIDQIRHLPDQIVKQIYQMIFRGEPIENTYMLDAYKYFQCVPPLSPF